MADDLDDDWWVEEPPTSIADDSGIKIAINGKKKKTKSTDNRETTTTTTEQSKNIEKKKLKMQKKKNSENSTNGASSNGVKTPKSKKKIRPFAKSSDLIQIIRQDFKKKKSQLELDEILDCYTPEQNVFCKCRENSKQSLNEYWSSIMSKKKWQKQVTKHNELCGAPILIIVASSAKRCIELGKDMKQWLSTQDESNGETLKDIVPKKSQCQCLFAKHHKIDEQIKMLSKTSNLNVIIGTPKRLDDLIEQKALNLKRLKYLCLDWNDENVKQQRLCDLQQIKQELLTLLTNDNSLRQKFKNKKAKICLF